MGAICALRTAQAQYSSMLFMPRSHFLRECLRFHSSTYHSSTRGAEPPCRSTLCLKKGTRTGPFPVFST